MQTFLLISLAFNVLLCVALAVSVRERLRAHRWADVALGEERENTRKEREKFERLLSEFGKLGAAVSKSLETIREDINRNYEHIHDGHVLDSLAYDLRGQVNRHGFAPGVQLGQERMDSVKASGGEVADDFMTLGELLEYGWLLHSKARARSGEICAVVSQPCESGEHPAWLGKTLAIYERICGGKELAIERMAGAVDAWRHEPTFIVPNYVRDVR